MPTRLQRDNETISLGIEQKLLNFVGKFPGLQKKRELPSSALGERFLKFSNVLLKEGLQKIVRHQQKLCIITLTGDLVCGIESLKNF